MTKLLPAATSLLLALALTGCGADDAAAPAAGETAASATAQDPAATASGAMEEDDAAEGDADAAMSTQGAWIDRAAYETDAATYHEAGDVVLFFNASWCPTCKETVTNLDADGTPAGLTVVSVDYDSSSDLKKQYGVTVQHTFVQVDAAGQELAKFTGSLTGAEIAAQTS